MTPSAISEIPDDEMGPVLIYGDKWSFDWEGERDETFWAVCTRYGGDSDDHWVVDNTVYYSTECLNPILWMPLPALPKPKARGVEG